MSLFETVRLTNENYLICQKLTTSSTSAILANTSLLRLCNRGTLRRKLTLSSKRCSPVRIIICWKTRRSSTHTFESDTTVEEKQTCWEFLLYGLHYNGNSTSHSTSTGILLSTFNPFIGWMGRRQV